MRPQFHRFYKEVSLAEEGLGWRLLLDGKPVKTPAGNTVQLTALPLSEAVAEEWRAQGKTADLASMPLTRLAMSLIDHVLPHIAEVRGEALAYGRTDLLCYRAASPEALAQRQAKAWQPLLDWAGEELGARLDLAEGVAVIDQSSAALGALDAATAELDAGRLLVLHGLTTRLGSLVLALAVLHGRLAALDAYSLSRLDEAYQAEKWGRDAEAEKRAAVIAAEVADLERFLSLIT